MAYQALYRKYRPQTFADVVGQNAIVDTLKNSIAQDKISHAFLFSGPRGTGKTSVAKIFAKAVNCLHPVYGEPCNDCANCVAANAGTMADLIEIDAASNNGVDEIRDIRSKAKYAPTEGKYKVYIIDEVHMLSMGAFNALLKTLEEPPEHVIFILATTELQKVPATIISRTQRYNFKQISEQEIYDRLVKILGLEQIAYDDEAIKIVAEVADGGMRDALSILDQIISHNSEKITVDDAIEITGFASKDKLKQLFEFLEQKDTAESLTLVTEILADGTTSFNVLNEIIDQATKKLVAIKTENVDGDIAQILNIIDQANVALNNLKMTSQQRIPLDIFCVTATRTKDVDNVGSDQSSEIAELKQQVEQLSEQVKKGNFASQKPTAKPIKKSTNPVKQTAQQNRYRQDVFAVLKTATKQNLDEIKNIWPELIDSLEVSKRAMMKISNPVAAGVEATVIAFDYPLWFEKAAEDTELQTYLETSLSNLINKNIKLVMIPADEWPVLRKEFIKNHKDELIGQTEGKQEDSEAENSAGNDILKQAEDLFGKENIEIKD